LGTQGLGVPADAKVMTVWLLRLVSIAVVLCPQTARADERPVPPQMAPATEARIDVVAARLRALVQEPGSEAGRVVTQAVRGGLPPAVLAVLLDVLREHPRLDLLPVVRALASDRRADIRGRALIAFAELGGLHAVAAIEAAADDVDPRLRQLAWALAQRHPSAAADELVRELWARDARLAALQGASS
jgi:hypothetical protein